MAEAIVISSPGLDSNDESAGRLKLFLTQFGGEVLKAYRRSRKTLGRHIERTIESGKAAEFPIMGRKAAKYLAPGKSLDDIRSAEKQTSKKILIDGLLTSDCLITDIDDAMNHYDIRSEYSYQIGEALAMAADGGVIAEIAKLAVANTEALPGLGKGGIVSRDVEGGMSSESEALGKAVIAMLLEVKTKMSKNYVPIEGRVCYMTPVCMNALVAAKDAINKEFGAVATIVDAQVTRVAGLDIVEVPDLTVGGADATDILQGDGHVFPAAYAAKCGFVVGHRSTVGTLTLRSFQLEHARRIERQADHIVGKYAIGHGGLRPEAAFIGVINTAITEEEENS